MVYAGVLYEDANALADLQEAVTTLVEVGRTARRVLGGAHPLTGELERELRRARAALAAHKSGAS